jgi:hypothetical protein
MISRLNAAHSGSDGFHHPGGFVSVHGGQPPTPRTFGVKDVAVADRTGGEFHLHFSNLWRSEFDVLNHEGFSEFSANGGFHGIPVQNDL